MKTELGIYSLFAFGALFCVVNFYLSFLRYPILKRIGKNEEEIGSPSGFPFIGTFVVLFSIAHLAQSFLFPLGIMIILIDTGGPHWLLGMVIYHAVINKKSV